MARQVQAKGWIDTIAFSINFLHIKVNNYDPHSQNYPFPWPGSALKQIGCDVIRTLEITGDTRWSLGKVETP